MLNEHQIFNCSLPEKTISFTFDDGPGETKGAGGGPRTLELAEYLADEGIYATFFVIGSRAKALPHIVRKVHALGHLIGNHTQDHVWLNKMVDENKDPSPQILEADATIREIIGLTNEPVLFRAPWGEWNSDVARRLQDDKRLGACIGPIKWDLPVKKNDWHYWGCQLPADACADAIFGDIVQNGSGIVVLHDHSFEERFVKGNLTFEMIKLLVPKLKASGYSFVRLDEIAEIKKAMGK